MILRLEDIKSASDILLSALDNRDLSIFTETLELKVENEILYLSITNREYFVKLSIPIYEDEDFKATVNAELFLKLISKITTETVEFVVSNNNLKIKANGVYNIPLIYENDKLLELPKINIDNITSEFDIDGNILLSVLNYNSKQLSVGVISKPVQKMFYIDEHGAITFTSGACINNFKLEKPIKILLNSNLVKLFKFFKNSPVHFKLGFDSISNGIIQKKVMFESDSVEITAILSCDDSMINSVPAAAIRNIALKQYDYSVVFNKQELVNTIDRFLIFAAGYGSKQIVKPYGRFIFNNNYVIINDINNINKEEIYYSNSVSNISNSYEAFIDLVEFKAVLDTCNIDHITICFGDHKAFVVIRDSIYNIIPECNTN